MLLHLNACFEIVHHYHHYLKYQNGILIILLIWVLCLEDVNLYKLPDISDWNTNIVTTFKAMFNSCIKLTELPDISKWNTSNITDMSFVFEGCTSLSKLPDISNWNTNNVTTFSEMFENCYVYFL